MKIAELFVNLGVKGGDDASKNVDGLKGKLGEARSAGLAAKAAIAGMILGVGKLAAESNNAGKSLRQFESLTGISNQVLQRWQYAGTQIGATNQEVENSFRSVQSAMTDLMMGGQGPEFFGLISQSVGLDPERLRDTEYVLKQLQEFAKTASPEIASKALGSFGLSDAVVAGMRKGAFNAEVFRKASIIYTDQEVKNLDRLNAKWGNFADTAQKIIGRLNAEFGDYFIDNLNKIADSIARLVGALINLAREVKALEKLDSAVKGAAKVAEIATALTSGDEKKSQKAKEEAASITGRAAKSSLDFLLGGIVENIPDWYLDFIGMKKGTAIRPNAPKSNGGNVQNNNVTVNQNFSGNADPVQVSKQTRIGIGNAFNQIGNRSLAN